MFLVSLSPIFGLNTGVQDGQNLLVLGHGTAIYQLRDALSISQNRKFGFSLPFSLPGLRLSPRAHPKSMIRRGFCFGYPLEKIFSLSFPVRQGNGFARALPASEALSRRSVAGGATAVRHI
jgi:hypothetical protein